MEAKKESVSATKTIQKAIEELLKKEEAVSFLTGTQTRESNVHIPEQWQDREIIKGILNRVDIADLVIVNLTPKDSHDHAPNPNVF